MLPIHFCSQCGAPTSLHMPAGEDRLRAVCSACGVIHYQNPRIITCTLATNAVGEILLAKRDIDPRRHLWTLPGGFMELHEDTSASAERELMEETHCRVNMGGLIAMISVPEIGQVHLMFHATLTHFDPRPTSESEAVAMFAPNSIPWEEIAFHTVKYTLQHYLTSPTTLLAATLERDRRLTIYE